MGRVISYIIGGALIALGGVAFVGAVEAVRAGATLETIAQSFLVPASLFVIGGFVIYMGMGGGRRDS